MKILNVFKKENKKTVKVMTQKLDKNQLEKVIGGGDPSEISKEPRRTVGAGQVIEIIK